MRYIVISLAQTAGVILLVIAGVLVGRRFWRVKSRVWIAAYAVAMLIVATIVTPRWLPRAELVWPFKWIVAGRTEFAVMAFVCPLLLTTPLSRLPQRRNRRAVALLMILITGHYSVLPFLMPAIEYPRLAGLETTLDTDGVCIQSTPFNCGPASAVTVLRSLGVPAEEGDLAIRSHTTRFVGAPMDSLCNAMREDYSVPASHGKAEETDSSPHVQGLYCGSVVCSYSFGKAQLDFGAVRTKSRWGSIGTGGGGNLAMIPN